MYLYMSGLGRVVSCRVVSGASVPCCPGMCRIVLAELPCCFCRFARVVRVARVARAVLPVLRVLCVLCCPGTHRLSPQPASLPAPSQPAS